MVDHQTQQEPSQNGDVGIDTAGTDATPKAQQEGGFPPPAVLSDSLSAPAPKGDGGGGDGADGKAPADAANTDRTVAKAEAAATTTTPTTTTTTTKKILSDLRRTRYLISDCHMSSMILASAFDVAFSVVVLFLSEA